MKYRAAISWSLVDAMERDPKVVLLGQNVTALHGVFGTTTEAFQRFPERVIEVGVSETMITGACVGLAMEGYRPIYVHPRCDWTTLSFEHLINTAAKIPFLHGKPLPFVMRVVVGRGWGQGPVHSQSWHHMLAQIPGLNVVVPALPGTYFCHLRKALEQRSPTIVFEPRRLFDADYAGITEALRYERPDVTILTIGDTVLDGIQAASVLRTLGIRANCHIWEDMTRPVLVPEGPVVLVDMVPCRPQPGVVSPPFIPQGVSQVFQRHWYPTPEDIVAAACRILDKKLPAMEKANGLYAPAGSPF